MSAPPSPSGDPREVDHAGLWLIGFVLLILGLRLALAGSLHLTEDEAYYRLWSQAPALGYFDHPPMISWWIWLGRHLAGDTPLGVRLLPCIGAAVASLLVLDLARLLGASPGGALWASVWYNATLLIAAGGFLAAPDSPAALFWLACLDGVARASAASSGTSASLRWWVVAGVAAGLAALSKYSALFLGPGLLLWLTTRAEGRRALKSAGPWLALACAAGVFSLNIGWNATHHWLTFAKQFGRIAPHHFAPLDLVDFLGVQFFLLNPLIALFLVRGLTTHRLVGRDRLSLLAISSAPFAGYLAIHALHDQVQAHWPAPLYAPLAMIAALAAGLEKPKSGWATLRKATPIVGLGAAGAALVLLLAPVQGLGLSFDLAKPLRGWPQFATRIEDARAQVGAGWIGTTSYGLAAQLLDQTQIHAPVLQISERDRWNGLAPSGADLAQPGLIVDLARRIQPDALRRCFEKVTVLGLITRGPPSGVSATYEAVRVAMPRKDIIKSGC